MKRFIVKFILILILIVSFVGCGGDSEKIELLKKAPVIELDYGSINSIFNHESIGTVDEFAEVYIERLGLNKDDFETEIEEIINNEIYSLTYEYKKESITFTIYFDKERYVYSPTFVIDSSNKENLRATLQYVTGI